MTPGRLEAAGRRQLALFGHQVGSHDYKREPACLGFDIQDAPEGVPEDAPEDALEDGLEDADFDHMQLGNKDLAAGLDCIGVVGLLTSDVGPVA